MIKLIKSFISLIAPKLSKVLRGSRGRFFKRAPWSPKASCNLAGCSRLSVLIFMLFILLSTIILPAIEKDLKDMSFEEASKKYQEITRVISFLKTDAPMNYPWSMNEFFDQSIYERLVGNEFFGYYYDEGVKYDNPGNRVAIDTIAVIKGRGYETYKDRYTRIFLQVLKLSEKHTYHIKKEARYSIGICIVSVKEKDDAESTKGIVLESYIKDRQTGKHFYHRFGTGSPGDLDQSLRLSAVRIICNLEYLRQKNIENSNGLASGGQLFEKSWTKTFVNLKEETR